MDVDHTQVDGYTQIVVRLCNEDVLLGKNSLELPADVAHAFNSALSAAWWLISFDSSSGDKLDVVRVKEIVFSSLSLYNRAIKGIVEFGVGREKAISLSPVLVLQSLLEEFDSSIVLAFHQSCVYAIVAFVELAQFLEDIASLKSVHVDSYKKKHMKDLLSGQSHLLIAMEAINRAHLMRRLGESLAEDRALSRSDMERELKSDKSSLNLALAREAARHSKLKKSSEHQAAIRKAVDDLFANGEGFLPNKTMAGRVEKLHPEIAPSTIREAVKKRAAENRKVGRDQA